MRYNTSTKDKVRKLRKSGLSLNEISAKMNIPKSTVREWISDIELSQEQREILNRKVSKALQEGRFKTQTRNRQKRIEKVDKLLKKGKIEIGKLSKKELLVAGVALYWAEGFKNKHEKRLGFCNSDPEMILFYLKWLKESLGIEKENLTARISLNISHENREVDVKNYWTTITGIPIAQFTTTFYQNTLWKKLYEDNNYHGVLRIHVKESLEHLFKMRGWIEGVKLGV